MERNGKKQYRMFALKDDPDQVVSARHKLTKMHWGSRIAQTLFLIFVYYFLMYGTALEQYSVELVHRTITNIS